MAAILSGLKPYRRLRIPLRHILALYFPGLADIPLPRAAQLTLLVWAVQKMETQ